jgi:hypothetical protein
LRSLGGIEHIEQGDHDQGYGGPKYQILQKVIQKKSSIVWNVSIELIKNNACLQY